MENDLEQQTESFECWAGFYQHRTIGSKTLSGELLNGFKEWFCSTMAYLTKVAKDNNKIDLMD